jgi:PHD/YefM family antitoxin component YafN of YafNO toxin-antitoxin module
MESNAEKAVKSLKLAEELTEIAVTMKDERSQQAVIEAAKHYEKMAEELTVKPQNQNPT